MPVFGSTRCLRCTPPVASFVRVGCFSAWCDRLWAVCDLVCLIRTTINLCYQKVYKKERALQCNALLTENGLTIIYHLPGYAAIAAISSSESSAGTKDRMILSYRPCTSGMTASVLSAALLART